KLNITGGKIVADGGVGVLMRGGSASITGGTIIATGTGEGKVGDSTVLSGHYGVLYDTQSGYPGLGDDSAVSISGSASVSAVDDCIAVRANAGEDENDRVVV